jgi:hypothetical protein
MPKKPCKYIESKLKEWKIICTHPEFISFDDDHCICMHGHDPIECPFNPKNKIEPIKYNYEEP